MRWPISDQRHGYWSGHGLRSAMQMVRRIAGWIEGELVSHCCTKCKTRARDDRRLAMARLWCSRSWHYISCASPVLTTLLASPMSDVSGIPGEAASEALTHPGRFGAWY
jgi:hypothetical protein